MHFKMDLKKTKSWRRKMTGKMPIVLPAWVAYTVLWLPKPYISVWTTHFHRVLHLWPHPPQIIVDWGPVCYGQMW